MVTVDSKQRVCTHHYEWGASLDQISRGGAQLKEYTWQVFFDYELTNIIQWKINPVATVVYNNMSWHEYPAYPLIVYCVALPL